MPSGRYSLLSCINDGGGHVKSLRGAVRLCEKDGAEQTRLAVREGSTEPLHRTYGEWEWPIAHALAQVERMPCLVDNTKASETSCGHTALVICVSCHGGQQQPERFMATQHTWKIVAACVAAHHLTLLNAAASCSMRLVMSVSDHWARSRSSWIIASSTACCFLLILAALLPFFLRGGAGQAYTQGQGTRGVAGNGEKGHVCCQTQR